MGIKRRTEEEIVEIPTVRGRAFKRSPLQTYSDTVDIAELVVICVVTSGREGPKHSGFGLVEAGGVEP